MGILGVGEYDVVLQGRGGAPILDLVQHNGISFSRRLDDASGASVTLTAFSSPALAVLDAWEHEIAIRRNSGQVWLGPIVSLVWDAAAYSITANDVFFWFERRLLEIGRQFVNVDLGTIFAQVASDALAAENSAGVLLAASLTGIKASRTIAANERRRAADVLRELSRTGVDFTTVCRTVRCGGREVPDTADFSLIDDTLLSPKATRKGEDMATEATVLGSNVEGDAVIGRVGDSTEQYGLVQQSYSESTIEDTESALAAAQTRWDFLQTPPTSISGVLAPDAPVDFDDLIPGARVNVTLNELDRPISGDFRLTQVDVSVRPSDQGEQEEVAVTLEPLGTVIGE